MCVCAVAFRTKTRRRRKRRRRKRRRRRRRRGGGGEEKRKRQSCSRALHTRVWSLPRPTRQESSFRDRKEGRKDSSLSRPPTPPPPTPKKPCTYCVLHHFFSCPVADDWQMITQPHDLWGPWGQESFIKHDYICSPQYYFGKLTHRTTSLNVNGK